jgi:hypothetical protein
MLYLIIESNIQVAISRKGVQQMERTRKELLQAIKEKAPELYEELFTESEKHHAQSQCRNQNDPEFQRGQGRGCGGQGRGRQWGGRRMGAGRPRMFCERKTITKQVSETTVNKIKEYAEANNISENEALDRLINAGYGNLKD